jgi:diguanylate cyclase (GGDEF)-like protein
LTGLPNHRAIEAWASHELPAAVRHGFSFWVVMIDLDHFTDVNDAHGHDAGDLVLGTFGEILKGNTRSSDISGRIGGEEFFTSSRMPTNRICRRSSYAHAPSRRRSRLRSANRSSG